MSDTTSSRGEDAERILLPGGMASDSEISRKASQRNYGDTYASGNARVQLGDSFHFHQAGDTLQRQIEALQKTLEFPVMHQRYEGLREAYDGTYEWILYSDNEVDGNHVEDEYFHHDRTETEPSYEDSSQDALSEDGGAVIEQSEDEEYQHEDLENDDPDTFPEFSLSAFSISSSSESPENESSEDDDIESEYGIEKRNWHMSTFFQWYEKSSGVYWISGKPGSGKSTLMKYLIGHLSPSKSESNQLGPIIIHFFFWAAGEDLQRSKLGCLRSLLWQLLHNPLSQEISAQLCGAKLKTTWTERRLQGALTDIIQHFGSSIIIFIDGLDESDDHEETLELLDVIVGIGNMKLCVSSRPEPVFVDRFQGLPNLKLQDLNGGDIRRFVIEKLQQDSRFMKLSSELDTVRREELEFLASSIEKKSEGVFLWAHLVVKDLLIGITNKDNLEKLVYRVDRLPSDIYELYQDMLRRAKSDAILYQEDSSLYLALILHQEFNLLEFYFAIDEDIRHKYLTASIMQGEHTEIDNISCETLATRISARTAGLLDVINPTWGVVYPQQPLEVSSPRDLRVRFVHRTARDFLQDTTAGKLLLKPVVNTDSKMQETCFQAKLVSDLIIPILQGHPHKFYAGADGVLPIFMCPACTDHSIVAGIREHKHVLDFTYQTLTAQSSMISINQDLWTDLPGTPYGVVSWNLPSRVEMWDLGPPLILSRRYAAAKAWVVDNGLMKDVRYLSNLLAPMRCSLGVFTGTREQVSGQYNQFWAWLLAHGAAVRTEISDNNGETSTALSTISLSSYFENYHVNANPENDARSMGITLEDYLTPTIPTCHTCYQTCLELARDVFRNEHGFELWGSFAIADQRSVGLQSDTFYHPFHAGVETSRQQDDRIMVLGSRLASKNVTLFEISEEDSYRLIQVLGTEGGPSGGGGCHGIVWYLSKRQRQVLDDVSQKSEIICFAEAMRIMGKSEENIRCVYEAAAKRMSSLPDDMLEKWRKWYWNSTEHVCGDNHSGGVKDEPPSCAFCTGYRRCPMQHHQVRLTWTTSYNNRHIKLN